MMSALRASNSVGAGGMRAASLSDLGFERSHQNISPFPPRPAYRSPWCSTGIAASRNRETRCPGRVGPGSTSRGKFGAYLSVCRSHGPARVYSLSPYFTLSVEAAVLRCAQAASPADPKVGYAHADIPLRDPMEWGLTNTLGVCYPINLKIRCFLKMLFKIPLRMFIKMFSRWYIQLTLTA